MLLHHLHQLDRVHEVAARIAAVGGGVAPEGEDVADARRGVLVEQRPDVGPGVADAGEVRHGRERPLGVHAHDDVAGVLLGGAQGAVRDRRERGLQGRQVAEGGMEPALGVLGLRREELEGERGPRRDGS